MLVAKAQAMTAIPSSETGQPSGSLVVAVIGCDKFPPMSILASGVASCHTMFGLVFQEFLVLGVKSWAWGTTKEIRAE